MLTAERRTPKNGGSIRRGPQRVRDLRNYAADLTKLAQDMRALADTMQAAEIAAVEMDGMTKASRGIALVDDYLATCEAELNREKRRRRKEEEDEENEQV